METSYLKKIEEVKEGEKAYFQDLWDRFRYIKNIEIDKSGCIVYPHAGKIVSKDISFAGTRMTSRELVPASDATERPTPEFLLELGEPESLELGDNIIIARNHSINIRIEDYNDDSELIVKQVRYSPELQAHFERPTPFYHTYKIRYIYRGKEECMLINAVDFETAFKQFNFKFLSEKSRKKKNREIYRVLDADLIE